MKTTPLALAAAALLGLGACASTDPAGPAGWKVEPVLAVRHAPGEAEAYYRLGRYHEGMQRQREALEAYAKATAADPAHADAWNALGVAHARAGRFALADDLLRRALALAPQRADLRSNLGYALLLAGRDEEAVTELRAALALDGDNPVIQDNLRLALERPVDPSPAPAAPAAGRVTTAAAEATPAAPTALSVRLEISNGMGRAGAADQLRRWLAERGVGVQQLSNQRPYVQATTVVQYADGQADAAQRLARQLPLPVSLQPSAGLRTELRVLLGRDWPQAAAERPRGLQGTKA